MTIYFYQVGHPYGCFSNFSAHGIVIESVYWSTVEHYYQAQKFIGTKDAVIIPKIRAAKTPQIAATLGRDCSRQLRRDWEVAKISVMREAVLKKFLTHSDIRELLLSTGDQCLVEDSPNDYFWGCGEQKTGQNYLGKILMSVRQEIRNLSPLSVISD